MFVLSHQKCPLGRGKCQGGQPRERGELSPGPELLRAACVPLTSAGGGPVQTCSLEGEWDTLTRTDISGLGAFCKGIPSLSAPDKC